MRVPNELGLANERANEYTQNLLYHGFGVFLIKCIRSLVSNSIKIGTVNSVHIQHLPFTHSHKHHQMLFIGTFMFQRVHTFFHKLVFADESFYLNQLNNDHSNSAPTLLLASYSFISVCLCLCVSVSVFKKNPKLLLFK